LALRGGSSPEPGWRDVARALRHYEELLEVKITLHTSLTGSDAAPNLMMLACAWKPGQKVGVQPPWASASLTASGTHLQNLGAVILFLLHDLDSQAFRVQQGLQQP
jgi:hypothetical protein